MPSRQRSRSKSSQATSGQPPDAVESLSTVESAKENLERDRLALRQRLLEGISSAPVGRMDERYFAALRRRIGR